MKGRVVIQRTLELVHSMLGVHYGGQTTVRQVHSSELGNNGFWDFWTLDNIQFFPFGSPDSELVGGFNFWRFGNH